MNKKSQADRIPSFKVCQRLINQASSLPTYTFDKCENNCIAYSGAYGQLKDCPICKCTRTYGFSENTWSFNSPIELLCERWKNVEIADLLQYRSTYEYQKDKIKDVWECSYIQMLMKKPIVIDGTTMESKHFEDKRESALALATDGINIFRSQSRSCWPLFLIDYLLPPQFRTKKNFAIHISVISGPLKGKQNFNSFLQPIVDSLKLLQVGKHVYDSFNKQYFLYRAHVTHIIGDSPAIHKLMGIKGTNAIYVIIYFY